MPIIYIDSGERYPVYSHYNESDCFRTKVSISRDTLDFLNMAEEVYNQYQSLLKELEVKAIITKQ